jgi:hypothetical protein
LEAPCEVFPVIDDIQHLLLNINGENFPLGDPLGDWKREIASARSNIGDP